MDYRSYSRRTFLCLSAVMTNRAHVTAQIPAPEPITILFSMTAKTGKEEELGALIPRLIRQSRADEGNLAYTFLQQRNNARDFVLFEQWRDAAALKGHLAHLQAVFGPPREGSSLPASILDLCEKTQAVSYRVVE